MPHFHSKTDLFRVFLLLFGCVIFSLNSLAQSAGDTYYEDAVFSPEIKSVQLFSNDDQLALPILKLGGDGQLLLKFDDLSGGLKSYSYTIVQCDADWHESFLIQSEYLGGFFENPIDDYALSFNTSMQYSNYQLLIPNDRVQLRYSGNYVLLVYEGNDREKVVLSRRFYVLDPKVQVTGQVKRATFDPYKGDNQEVDFSVFPTQLKLDDPFREVKVVVVKNNCWDTGIKGLKPIFVRKDELVYDYDKENVFQGGNEYRYFDIRSWKYNGENVDAIGQFDQYYHVTLAKDELRSNKKYFFYREMNGKYRIESQDREVTDPDTECDYGFVHFSLAVPVPLVGGSVHVFGALSDWKTGTETAMVWNDKTKEYELTLLLKQGYYNYQYVYVDKGDQKIDESVLEGSFYETENDYQIYVYYRGLSGRYDQLVGFQQLSSMN